MPIDSNLLHDMLRRRATARPTSAAKEARERESADLEQRQAANTILKPNEVSGEYDAGRLLMTTRRGTLRPITHADIRAFQQNIARLKKDRRFTGGITAQDVIDLSLDTDRKRANAEIRTSVPVAVKADVFHFVTNSGPDSDVSRHHVHVEFMDFESEVAASKLDPKKIGKAVAKGKLKFNCDCGRHRYWFRYIATIGHYNYSRPETGYPKIRNPKLQGVACKHVLRTMHVILRDAAIHNRIADQVVKARAVLDKKLLKVERVKAAELRAHADEQAAKSTQSTNLRRSSKAVKAEQTAKVKARNKMAKKAAEKLPNNPTPAQVSAATKKAIAGLQAALQLGAITQTMFDTAIANLGKVK